MIFSLQDNKHSEESLEHGDNQILEEDEECSVEKGKLALLKHCFHSTDLRIVV